MRISDWSSDVCSSDLVELQPRRVRIAPLTEKLTATFGPMATKKDLTLRMDISTDAPDSIETDPLRLEQVLKNFLSNAVKFTHNGEVVLHISSTAEDCLAFTVRDTGRSEEHTSELQSLMRT